MVSGRATESVLVTRYGVGVWGTVRWCGVDPYEGNNAMVRISPMNAQITNTPSDLKSLLM